MNFLDLISEIIHTLPTVSIMFVWSMSPNLGQLVKPTDPLKRHKRKGKNINLENGRFHKQKHLNPLFFYLYIIYILQGV